MQTANQLTADTVDFATVFAGLASRTPAEATATIAGQNVRLVAFEGVGGWHKHDTAEETVIVWSGQFDVEYHDRIVRLQAGQCTVIAAGQEHRGVSVDGAQVVLLRPANR